MRSAPFNGRLAVAVMDALTSNICVVDPAGFIIAVNRAWSEFSSTNAGDTGKAYIGVNYLNVCRHSDGPASDEAVGFHAGMKTVLEGQSELFEMEYPCHSPTELRWFLARVTPLRRRATSTRRKGIGAVVSHMNITDRKLIELSYAKLASTDPLTGIPNRRFFDQYAELEFQRFRRFGGSVSMMMLDLDNFKRINDSYGHPAGDEVLRQVALCLRQSSRDTDLFARLGGEEFIALLPGTDMPGALVLAEKLRDAIEGLQIIEGSQLIPVTTSIGVTCIVVSDPSVETAVRRADQALYRAKSDGRNVVRSEFQFGRVPGNE